MDARWFLVAKCWNDEKKRIGEPQGPPTGVPISDYIGVDYSRSGTPSLKWDREDNQFHKGCVTEGDEKPRLFLDRDGILYLTAHCYRRDRRNNGGAEFASYVRLNINEHISNVNGQLKVDTDW